MRVTSSIRHAVKRYGSVTVIPDFSINIQEGELFPLLGSFSCDMEPGKQGFQNYTIFEALINKSGGCPHGQPPDLPFSIP